MTLPHPPLHLLLSVGRIPASSTSGSPVPGVQYLFGRLLTLSKSFVCRLLAGLDGKVLTGNGRPASLHFSFCSRLLWIFKFHHFYWAFFLLQNQGPGYFLCSRKTAWDVKQGTEDIQERRAAVGSGFGGLASVLFIASSQSGKKKANEHVGRKEDPSLAILGPQQDLSPLCGCEVIYHSCFSHHYKINLQRQR